MIICCILTFIAAEAAKTTVAIATTAIVGGIVWLATLWHRSFALHALLSNEHRSFNLHFRGDEKPERCKTIHFLANGNIQEPNGNEDFWRVRWGTLEIGSRGQKVFSRFKWDKKRGRLVHTNDPTLPSVMGQYIVPSVIPGEKQPEIYTEKED